MSIDLISPDQFLNRSSDVRSVLPNMRTNAKNDDDDYTVLQAVMHTCRANLAKSTLACVPERAKPRSKYKDGCLQGVSGIRIESMNAKQ